MASLLTLKILEGYTRPVVMLGKRVTCLIDTGSDIPVWTRGSIALKKAYQAERIDGKKFILSGFGKEAEIVDVYRVSNVIFEGGEDHNDRIVFRSLTVACTVRPSIIANLIMPATAFSHMNYTIRNMGVDQPEVEIEHDKEEYAVSPIYSQTDERFIERVYSFTSQ